MTTIQLPVHAVHLIPYDGVGGVEAAARLMALPQERVKEGVSFRLQYIFPDVFDRGGRRKTFNALRFVAALRSLYAARPDVVIVSLWRSAVVGVMLRAIGWRGHLVLFLHSGADAHLIDRVITRATARLAHEIWADSAVTAETRLPQSLLDTQIIRVIPFLFRNITPLPFAGGQTKPSPVLMFWGRLAPEKNLGRALKFFAMLRELRPDARFLIIGPDGGSESALRREALRLDIADAVEFFPAMPFKEIVELTRQESATFALHSSTREGMGLSVVEAMKLGLVPIASPVGEITRYARDGENAILLDPLSDAADSAIVAKAVALLDDTAALIRLHQGAIDTWVDQPTYGAAIRCAVHTVMQGTR